MSEAFPSERSAYDCGDGAFDDDNEDENASVSETKMDLERIRGAVREF